MSWATNIIAKLEKGETVTFHPKGNSMTPKIKSGEEVIAIPAKTAEVGDVVLCRVGGKQYLHLVAAVSKGRYLIQNNHGHTNGWTKRIYGKAISAGGRKL